LGLANGGGGGGDDDDEQKVALTCKRTQAQLIEWAQMDGKKKSQRELAHRRACKYCARRLQDMPNSDRS